MATSLITTIETDLTAGENWLKDELVTTATGVWEILKVVFEALTVQQAQVILDVLGKVQTDATAGKSLEEIETDMLNTATADEAALLKAAGSQLIQGLIALVQASSVSAS